MRNESAPPEYLIVGHVLAPAGRWGEVQVQVVTDFPDRFDPGQSVYIEGQPYRIESSRPHKQHLVVKLADIDNISDAEALRDCELTIPRTLLRPLPPGEYYAFELVGLDVVTTGGEKLGYIADIMSTASNDIYVMVGDRGEALIPAIEDVVKSIDTEKGQVVIEVIDGLLPW